MTAVEGAAVKGAVVAVAAAVVTVAAAMEGAAVMAVEGDEEQGEGGEEKNCTSKDISFKGSSTHGNHGVHALRAPCPTPAQ